MYAVDSSTEFEWFADAKNWDLNTTWGFTARQGFRVMSRKTAKDNATFKHGERPFVQVSPAIELLIPLEFIAQATWQA